MGKSDVVTNGIRVTVHSAHVPERSKPDEDYFFFAYSVCVRNESRGEVQLLSRHWWISDGNGETREVEGPGVVGRTPSLNEGEEFRYTSFCPLPTPVGAMRGTYQMIDVEGDAFDVEVGIFQLALDYAIN